MEIIDLKEPDVLIIKNFLNEEEVQKILNILKSCDEETWEITSKEKQNKNYKSDKSREGDKKHWYGMTLDLTSRVNSKNYFPQLPHEFLIQKEFEIKKLVEKRFKDPLILQLSGLHRWRPGREQQPHIDYYDSSEDHDFEMLEKYNLPKDALEEFEKDFNDKHYSSLVYFNTDYVGGELYMPQWNWEIKPEPGMLICFKGDENHLHGVKMIEEGIRYTWSIFWTKMEWALKNKLPMLK